MNLKLGTRPWKYLLLGPFIGLFCLFMYSEIRSNLGFDDNNVLLRDTDSLLALYFYAAYSIGALPALLAGLVMELVSRILKNNLGNVFLKITLSFSVGLLATICMTMLSSNYSNGTYLFFKTDPLSQLPVSIYGAIAAVLCESLHLKMTNAN